jgi:hypothetical protein
MTGIGTLTTSSAITTVVDANHYKNGRISRLGDTYLRSLSGTKSQEQAAKGTETSLRASRPPTALDYRGIRTRSLILQGYRVIAVNEGKRI